MVTNKKSCEAAVHFNSTSHSLQDFSFQCIDQISHDCTQVDKLLITKEAYWSAQLFTLNHLFYMVLTKDRNSILRIEFILILLMTNITLLGVFFFTLSVTTA